MIIATTVKYPYVKQNDIIKNRGWRNFFNNILPTGTSSTPVKFEQPLQQRDKELGRKNFKDITNVLEQYD